jgi:hypothetical protein
VNTGSPLFHLHWTFHIQAVELSRLLFKISGATLISTSRAKLPRHRELILYRDCCSSSIDQAGAAFPLNSRFGNKPAATS